MLAEFVPEVDPGKGDAPEELPDDLSTLDLGAVEGSRAARTQISVCPADLPHLLGSFDMNRPFHHWPSLSNLASTMAVRCGKPARSFTILWAVW